MTTSTTEARFDSHALLRAWGGAERKAKLLRKATPLTLGAAPQEKRRNDDFDFAPMPVVVKMRGGARGMTAYFESSSSDLAGALLHARWSWSWQEPSTEAAETHEADEPERKEVRRAVHALIRLSTEASKNGLHEGNAVQLPLQHGRFITWAPEWARLAPSTAIPSEVAALWKQTEDRHPKLDDLRDWVKQHEDDIPARYRSKKGQRGWPEVLKNLRT